MCENEENKEQSKNGIKTINNQINDNFKENESYIIATINIKKEDINKNIRIINSFEEVNKDFYFGKEEDRHKYENEKEIKKCKIKINDKIIPFSYYYQFLEEGNFIIKYIFTEDIKNINYMFYDCSYFINIDFTNFNAKNITNMSYMFCYCNLLKYINLSNLNTQNVTDMSRMFTGCESLTTIDLSHNFNTQNVTNMSYMFSRCFSLVNLDLTNFNTQNVTDMNFMFSRCRSLIKIDLSSFNTKNVTRMVRLFSGCNSLINLDISHFNTQNVTEVHSVFDRCYSLIKKCLIKIEN